MSPNLSAFELVFVAQDGPQAHLLATRLQEAGIPAQVDGESLRMALGAIPLGYQTDPRVLVPADCKARAYRIVREFEDECVHANENATRPTLRIRLVVKVTILLLLAAWAFVRVTRWLD